MTVPNPFQKLCFHPGVFYALRIVWEVLKYQTLQCVLDSLWTQLQNAHLRNHHARVASMSQTTESLRLRNQIMDVIADSPFDTIPEITEIIVDFLDMDELILSMLNRQSHRGPVYLARLNLDRMHKFLIGKEAISVCGWIVSIIAVIAQFHSYRTNQLKNSSGWRQYQSLVIATFYGAHSPMVPMLFIDSGLNYESIQRVWKVKVSGGPTSFVGVLIQLWWLRLLMPMLWMLPMMITHFTASLVIFVVPASIVLFTLAFCLSFIIDSLKPWELGEPSSNVMVALLELVLITGVSTFVRWTSGQEFGLSFSDSLDYGYCRELITFQSDQFSWKEWAVILGWVLT